MLSVGSLFSGIGGFDLGLERAGMRTLWQVELDPFCRSILERRFPHAERHEDVCAVGADNLEPVDVICGGFPCQDLSLAGTGEGLDGARSGLWSEYARVVGELRPRYVVVENVAALLARGLERVLGDLAALGYDAEWDCIPASAVGAPHRRDRLWLVAYPHEVGCARGARQSGAGWRDEPENGSALPDASCDGCRQGWPGRPPGGSRGPTERALGRPRADQGWAVDDALGGRHGAPDWEVRPGRDGPVGAGWWATEPNVDRMAHGIPARVDRTAALGNALVPQIAEWIGRRILEWEGGVDAVARAAP